MWNRNIFANRVYVRRKAPFHTKVWRRKKYNRLKGYNKYWKIVLVLLFKLKINLQYKYYYKSKFYYLFIYTRRNVNGFTLFVGIKLNNFNTENL